jgi:hypothetical protein
MFLALVPFFLLIHSRSYLKLNSDDQKHNFMKKLTAESSPTFYYVVFILMNNLEILMFITIFFSGVNKIDLYHIALMFFFVAWVIWPNCFKKNYILLLVYCDFFVFEKYLYTLCIPYIKPTGFYANFSTVLGLSSEYNPTNKYFRYPPWFQ